MKKLALLLIVISVFSCNKKEEQYDLTVQVNIEGLKKGTAYLKKANDTTLIIVDSLAINGNSKFELHADLDSPEMYYLFLDKNNNEERNIPFFASKGIIQINTTLKNFELDVKITGSHQQKTLEDYNKIIVQFNDRNLELIKENFEAQRDQDTAKISAINMESDNLLKRKYLYTVNFAMNNKDSEVAPYLALSEIYDANVKWLDTINNSLAPEIKTSKYGKELQVYIDEIKGVEK
jgi:hypothetical protein